MSLDEFRAAMRLARGKLTKHDEDMEMIYNHGIPDLKDFSLTKKLMGVHNIAWIATQSERYQRKFCNWMADKNWKADKNELDLWFSENREQLF